MTPVTGSEMTAGPDPRGASKGREDAASTSEAASARRDRAGAVAPETPGRECGGRGAARRGEDLALTGLPSTSESSPTTSPGPSSATSLSRSAPASPPRTRTTARPERTMKRSPESGLSCSHSACPAGNSSSRASSARSRRSSGSSAAKSGTPRRNCIRAMRVRPSDPGQGRRPGSPGRAPRPRTR